MNWRQFEAFARVRLGEYYGVELVESQPPGFPKRFDLVSADFQFVGDAKYLSLVGGVRLPPAKFSIIAEHVVSA
jgi:hypothetical protein